MTSERKVRTCSSLKSVRDADSTDETGRTHRCNFECVSNSLLTIETMVMLGKVERAHQTVGPRAYSISTGESSCCHGLIGSKVQ